MVKDKILRRYIIDLESIVSKANNDPKIRKMFKSLDKNKGLYDRIRSEILDLSEKTLFMYNPKTDSFERLERLPKVIKHPIKAVSRVDASGNIILGSDYVVSEDDLAQNRISTQVPNDYYIFKMVEDTVSTIIDRCLKYRREGSPDPKSVMKSYYSDTEIDRDAFEAQAQFSQIRARIRKLNDTIRELSALQSRLMNSFDPAVDFSERRNHIDQLTKQLADREYERVSLFETLKDRYEQVKEQTLDREDFVYEELFLETESDIRETLRDFSWNIVSVDIKPKFRCIILDILDRDYRIERFEELLSQGVITIN